jgi:hypothetical protein
VPFLVAATVAVAGLASGQTETATIGIFLLAATACAVLLPLPAHPGADRLMMLSLACTAGLIGLYPAAVGIAGPAIGHLETTGTPVLVIFVVTGAIGVAAILATAGMSVWRPARPAGRASGPRFPGHGALRVRADGSSMGSDQAPADRTAKYPPRARLTNDK